MFPGMQSACPVSTHLYQRDVAHPYWQPVLVGGMYLSKQSPSDETSNDKHSHTLVWCTVPSQSQAAMEQVWLAARWHIRLNALRQATACLYREHTQQHFGPLSNNTFAYTLYMYIMPCL